MAYPDYLPSKSFVYEDDMGTNAPVIHQRIIARLTAGLYPLYLSGRIPYEPLPEMILTEGYSSPTPDLSLFNEVTEQTIVIIEVCQTRGLKADLDKVVRLTDGELYGIQEGFVFNYKTGRWLRYRKGDGGLVTESAVSDILQLDLSGFLH